jgi:hypothetical protein
VTQCRSSPYRRSLDPVPRMPFVKEFYDPETLQLMTRALKEALREADCFTGDAASDEGLRMTMAGRIMAAVAAGEHDLEVLKQAALRPADAQRRKG